MNGYIPEGTIVLALRRDPRLPNPYGDSYIVILNKDYFVFSVETKNRIKVYSSNNGDAVTIKFPTDIQTKTGIWGFNVSETDIRYYPERE